MSNNCFSKIQYLVKYTKSFCYVKYTFHYTSVNIKEVYIIYPKCKKYFVSAEDFDDKSRAVEYMVL